MAKAASVFDRRHFIGGSDARIIMGKDEKALLRLWCESRSNNPSLKRPICLAAPEQNCGS